MALRMRSFVALILLSATISLTSSEKSVARSDAGDSSQVSEERISLLGLPSLTFTASSYTTARRGTPHKQLECIGGDAQEAKQRYPMRVDCYNIGIDEEAPADKPRPKWHCVSALHRGVRIENWKVNCEGWSYPDDEFILAGSCWLAYELQYEEELPPPEQGQDGASAAVEDKRRWSGLDNFFSQLRNLLFVLAAVYVFVRFGWPLIVTRTTAAERADPETVPLVKKEDPHRDSGELSSADR